MLTFSQVRYLCIGILIGYFCQYPSTGTNNSSFFSWFASPSSLQRSTVYENTNKWSKLGSTVKVSLPAQLSELQAKALSIAEKDPLQQHELILALTTAGTVESQVEIFVQRLQQLGIHQRLLLIVFDNELLGDNGLCNRMRIACFFHRPLDYPWAHQRSFREVVSAMKFYFLSELLKIGLNILLSDTDIVYLDNPFCWLHRDSDIEGQTDGANTVQSYGYYEVIDDLPLPPPFRYSVYFLNSGFFYIRSSETTVAIMIAIANRLAVTNMWDQAAFNDEVWSPRTETNYPFASGLTIEHEYYLLQELFGIGSSSTTPVDKNVFFTPTAADYRKVTYDRLSQGNNILDKLLWLRYYRQRIRIGGRQPRVRIMNYLRFTNSKVAIHHFQDNFGNDKASLCPVMVHINYHTEKAELMTKVMTEYFTNCVITIPREKCGILPHTSPIPYLLNTGGTGGPYSDTIVSQRELFYTAVRKQFTSLFTVVTKESTGMGKDGGSGSPTNPEASPSSADLSVTDSSLYTELTRLAPYSPALQEIMHQLYVSGVPEVHGNDSYRTVILPEIRKMYEQAINELTILSSTTSNSKNNIPLPEMLVVPWDEEI